MTSPSDHSTSSPGLRASDADRERVAAALRRHHLDGRLDTDELQERLERCYAARTAGDLAPLTADLPEDERPRAQRRGAGPPPRAAIGAVVLAAFLVALTILQLVLGTLGSDEPWVGAFHGLNALAVTAAAGTLTGKTFERP